MKILLATDGSEHSKAAAQEMADRPFPIHSELRIISVFENPSLYLYPPPPMGGMEKFYENADFTAKKIAEDAVEAVTELISKKNTKLAISTAVVQGAPKQVILDESEKFGADLIVVGSHGRGGFERFLLGSVSQSVALHAQCSVEIVRKRNLKKDDQ